MKKISNLFIIVILVSVLCLPLLAHGTEASREELIRSLQQKIEQLKAQIKTLQVQLEAMRQTKQEIKGLTRQLREGVSGEDVKLLQQILATDPEIYPEKKITGYFGSMTAKAVKKFQKKACLEEVGSIGPKTLKRINELLKEGAGESGKVPPGLLIAPGIRKKLCGITPQPLPGQILPPGIEKKVGTTTPPADGVRPVLDLGIF